MTEQLTCWTCKRSVRKPMLVATHEGGALDSNDFADDFKPIVWRITHSMDECLPDAQNKTLYAAMPQTPLAWIQMTIRLLDMKGEWFLFKMTNWRYLLDCAQENQEGYYPTINKYKNPKPVRRKAADPETELPDGGRKTRIVVRRKPGTVRIKRRTK